MSLLGIDSWMPPDQALLDAMAHTQHVWMGGYVGGPDLYLNTPWPKSAWDLLRANQWAPLPIYVPSQILKQDPVQAGNEAVDLTAQNGMNGVVAIDSEYSMTSVLGFEAWLDQCAAQIIKRGWIPVTFAGAHHVAIGSYAWNVAWGESWLVPPPNQALQYGPFTDITTGRRLDADNADDLFPFASWTGEKIMTTLNAPICGMYVKPDESGYWLVGRDGGIFAFGSAEKPGEDARFNPVLVTPDTDQEVTGCTGVGATSLYLFKADGGVFTYGTAQFHGSVPGIPINPSTLPPEG